MATRGYLQSIATGYQSRDPCRKLTHVKGPLQETLQTQNEGEGAKVTLRHDVLIALSRCAVHILPSTLLTGLVWINYSNLYMGATFVVDPKMDTIFLAGIQLAAKVQELLCVASLTTIVLQALRTECM